LGVDAQLGAHLVEGMAVGASESEITSAFYDGPACITDLSEVFIETFS
jgi:hypothetical protein